LGSDFVARKPTKQAEASAAAETGITEQPVVSGTLPLYRDARPVLPETHGHRAIAAGASGFGFAANAPLIPITVDEFERAALDYPIVFVGPAKRAFVVTGLGADKNLFIEGESYRPGAYVPAYLRRYPFVFARDEADQVRILCLDEASDRIVDASEAGSMPLFDGDQPTDATRHALAFCQEFEAAEKGTELFVALLGELDLLTPQQAHLNPPSADGTSEPQSELLLDYLSIDRAKLEALSAESWQLLTKTRAVGPVYAQLLSIANWGVLAERRI
jgi:hypothetical protein